MQVKHLIKWLSKFDQELEVVTMTPIREIGEIDCVVPYTRKMCEENIITGTTEKVIILCDDFTFEERL